MAAPREPRLIAISHRLYRGLMLAYPRRFRGEYREEMALTFRDSAREVYRSKRKWGVPQLCARALLDLMHNVPKE